MDKDSNFIDSNEKVIQFSKLNNPVYDSKVDNSYLPPFKEVLLAIEKGDLYVKLDISGKYLGYSDPRLLNYLWDVYLTNEFIEVADNNIAVKEILNALEKLNSQLNQSLENAKNFANLEFLLNRGADINAIDKDNCNLLHNALKAGSIKPVEILIKRDANINAQDKWGWTPLNYTVRNLRKDITKLLIKSKANIN
ncbi:MAG: ankyrin repeat domain-containing protein [Sphingobacteriia bacterium]|nr:ankyrin repeat domain-containing protein [Sphingobacteriia bacterium]